VTKDKICEEQCCGRVSCFIGIREVEGSFDSYDLQTICLGLICYKKNSVLMMKVCNKNIYEYEYDLHDEKYNELATKTCFARAHLLVN
jgi:predicted metal-binding protein